MTDVTVNFQTVCGMGMVDDFDIERVEKNWLIVREGMTERVRQITAGMLLETAVAAHQKFREDSILFKDSGWERIAK